MNNNTQCRKWQITQNNPNDFELDHNKIKEILGEFKNMVYYCMCDEIGENNTYHTHIFFYTANGVRFSTVKNRFPKAHIEMARGTNKENRNYVRKEGEKYKDKKETNLETTFEEWGELPIDRQGARTDLDNLYDVIKTGANIGEILEDYPEYLLKIDKVQKAIDTINAKQYKTTLRKVTVNYVYGCPRSGKTSHFFGGLFDYSECYRVSSYEHPFDNYSGEKILILDEFRSSFKLEFMLNIMDVYPLQLPSRYNNKWASFEEVYIISNMPLMQQYQNIQKSDSKTKDMQFHAFLKRIKYVWVFNDPKTREVEFCGSLEDYIKLYNDFGKKREQPIKQFSFADYIPNEEIPF